MYVVYEPQMLPMITGVIDKEVLSERGT